MKVTLDTNIWIDIAARPKKFKESIEVFDWLRNGAHELCLALSSYTTIYYLLSKLLTHHAALEFVTQLKQHSVKMLPFTMKEVLHAHLLQFKDHEDACIAISAFHNSCEYIITRNIKDFKHSPVPAITPKAFLDLHT